MRLALPAAILLLAGCVSTPTLTVDNTPDFVTMHWECGFVPEGTICEHAWVDAAFGVWAFRGSSTEGTGKISFNGDHPGMTGDQAKGLLKKAGLYTETRDFTLEGAFGGKATEDEMLELLRAAQLFSRTEPAYNKHQTLVDAGTLVISTTTNDGGDSPDTTHTSRAYNGAGDEDFDQMRDAITEVIERVATDAGIDY